MFRRTVPDVRRQHRGSATTLSLAMARLRAVRDRLHDSDRAFLLLCLSLPLFATAVAFVLAVALTGFGVPTVGTLRSTVAAFAYVYLTLALMCAPAYIAGCVWFYWSTRHDGDKALARLYTTPLIGALFVWFPSLYLAPVPLAQKVSLFPAVAVTAVLAGYVWVGLVRLFFYAWSRK